MFGDKISYVETGVEFPTVDIDYEHDFFYAEYLYTKYSKQYNFNVEWSQKSL